MMSYFHTKHACVCIITTKKNGTLYTSVTSKLANRIMF
ncbi:hypothetical protein MNBD_GAMMA22-1193 [hydrothermal vent metagenome]|uniref:Uncharacterized protein n=1 Tax=hydrothermal vent metagenome TaxID=652676 RepID=A0A3B0ZX42_9ZZZZ